MLGVMRPIKALRMQPRAHMAVVRWLGCEDGRIWREMEGGEAKEEKEEREGGGTTTSPNLPPLPIPPYHKKAKAGKGTKKKKKSESESDNDSNHPTSFSASPS